MSTTTPPPSPTTPAADPAAPTLAAAPTATHPFDMSDLLFAIEHLARLFRLEVDTTRELTYRTDFPPPIKIGRRWLWFPDEVLAWPRKQKRYSTDERKRNAGVPASEASVDQPTIKPYKPRAKKTRPAASTAQGEQQGGLVAVELGNGCRRSGSAAPGVAGWCPAAVRWGRGSR